MTLQFIDSFDVYHTGGYGLELIEERWGGVDTVWNGGHDFELFDSSISRHKEYSPSYCFKLLSEGTRLFLDFDNFSNLDNSGVLGFAVRYAGNAKHESYDDSLYPILKFWQRDSGELLVQSAVLVRTKPGTLAVLNYLDETICSGTTVLENNKWYYIELQFHNSEGLYNAPVGAYKMYVDGEFEVKSAANAKTADWDGKFRGLSFESVDGSDETIAVYIDDFYLTSINGTTNTGVLGDIAIKPLFANNEGDNIDFVGQDGDSTNNYLNINELLSDQGATHNSGLTADEYDLYKFTDCIDGTAEVYGVQLTNRVKVEHSGLRVFCPVSQKFGGSVIEHSYVYDANRTGVNYTYYKEVLDEDPDTNAQWMATGINSYQFGLRIK